MRPVGIHLRSPMRNIPKYLPPVVIPCQRPPLKEDPYVRPRQSKFIESLNLLSKAKAASLQRKTSVETVECDIIDLTTEETPKVPITPKSPRTLMSQLSRDMSPTASTRLSLTLEPKESEKEDSSSESGVESEQSSKVSKIKIASLLHIDLTSPLGQRLQKHIVIDKPEKTENSDNENYEHYCRTPKKNDSLARLRHRKDMFPNTFRRKRTRDFFYHTYKFNKKQRKEFLIKMKTGLTKRSRYLVKLMRPSRVVLHKLTKIQIAELSKPRPYGLQWASWNGDARRSFYAHNNYVMNSAEDLRRLRSGPGNPGMSATRLFGGFNAQGKPMTVYRPAPGSHMHMPSAELLRHLTHSQVPMGHQFNHLRLPSVPSYRPQHMLQPQPLAPHNLQRLQKGIKRNREQDDDVISISSSDDESSSKSTHPAKKVKRVTGTSTNRSQTVLFKCHLCAAEILFSLETSEFIRRHFADKHGVRNIRIMEQKDSTGQLVLSIVEDPPGRPTIQPAKPSLQNIDKRKTDVRQPVKVAMDDVICID